MSNTQTALTRALALIVLASVAAACGGKSDEKASKREAAAKATVEAKQGEGKAGGGAVATEDDGMANAVAVGKTAAAVDLKYDIATRPVVGQPLEVELVFLPRVAGESLEIEATGMPGLVVASGATARFDNVAAGERYTTKVLVQVSEQGLYYIGVTAKLATPIQTDARTFSVPVVVGTLPAEQKPAAAQAASAAADAETLKTMPAVETTTK